MDNIIIDPVVGMPATIYLGSDCYPYTIIDVSFSKQTIKLQADTYKLISGSCASENQEYEYTQDNDGIIKSARKRKNGNFYLPHSNTRVILGYRRSYHDPSF